MSLLRPLVARCQELAAALAAQARLSLFALLADPRLTAQRERARAASLRLEQASGLEELLSRHFQLRPRNVAWPRALRPDLAGLFDGEAASLPRTDALLEEVALQAARSCRDAREAAGNSDLLEALRPALEAIGRSLPAAEGATTGLCAIAGEAIPRAAEQVVRGPIRVSMDPIFAEDFSVLDPAARAAMDSHRAPASWCLSTREAMAAELCALSSIEHDGLPLAFHRDLAKQCWDEVRHAQLFLEIGIAELPDFLARAPADHPLLPGARRFAAEGTGLPAPREGNLYEAIWNCSLQERLVLMHLDTEGPGVGGFVRDLRSDFCRARPEVAEKLRVALHDEASHARLGRRWLEHLLPDPAERAAKAGEARRLRGLLLLAGIAGHERQPLLAVLQERLPGLARRTEVDSLARASVVE